MASESLSDLREFAAELAWQAGKLTQHRPDCAAPRGRGERCERIGLDPERLVRR